ncbi:serine hydrolase [Dendrosporobacter sp. 1207_IL3150]|uniref:serine hydrolase n=1 Tax=Dendrosporobacter sp. 1207_IL3150 TaxID=3084054 RepID=UPI002FD9DE83
MVRKIPIILVVLLMFSTTAFAASALEKEIKKDLNSFNGKVGVYAKNLKTGKVFDYNENEVFPTASTSKLVVAMATYQYLYPTADARKKSMYDNDIRYMMVISDNASFDELLIELDTKKPDALKKVTNDLRLKKTQIHSKEAYKKYNYHSVTTPSEMAKVFETIYTDKYLDKRKTNDLKYYLGNTIFHDEIPRHMMTPVYHKVGQLDDVLCDVGVIDDGKDQILISAYTRTKQSDVYASDFIANISAKLYNELRRK